MNPLCAHFGTCGGCSFQDLDAADYRARKREVVIRALARHGLEGADVAEIVEVAPATRRRCVFKIVKRAGAVAIGFHARASHAIVDMRECRVLTPGLFALVAPLRAVLGEVLHEDETAELHATETDTGFDLALRWKRRASPSQTAAFAGWAGQHDVARITTGNDILVALAKPRIGMGDARIDLPPQAFLQPTRAGEAYLQRHVADALAGAKSIADLFAGCGTFALALAPRARVHAVEIDGAMVDALAVAARASRGLKPVTVEKRDLFKRPLTARELSAYDAVALDPPRAGAQAQITELAGSSVRRIAYVSCNPQTFARDARLLSDAGYRPGEVVPVDQFLWSEHIELVASFERR